MSSALSRSRNAPFGGTPGALKRYRIMAFIVGVGLATVCFVGIPLQVAGGNKWPWTAVVEIVGTAHGFFYIIYLIACLDLASRARFRIPQLLGMVCSGFLPLLAFYMERRVTRRVSAQLALGAGAPPSPAAVVWSALTGRRPRPGTTPAAGASTEPGGTQSDGPVPAPSDGPVPAPDAGTSVPSPRPGGNNAS